MKKAKVYTKTGDKGQTGLVSGTRVSKGSERLNLYGSSLFLLLPKFKDKYITLTLLSQLRLFQRFLTILKHF